jgi:hypothetical protein
VTLADADRAVEDVAADELAQQLLAATADAQFTIDLPADYLSLDPNYDPLANWSPD